MLLAELMRPGMLILYRYRIGMPFTPGGIGYFGQDPLQVIILVITVITADGVVDVGEITAVGQHTDSACRSFSGLFFDAVPDCFIQRH